MKWNKMERNKSQGDLHRLDRERDSEEEMKRAMGKIAAWFLAVSLLCLTVCSPETVWASEPVIPAESSMVAAEAQRKGP